MAKTYDEEDYELMPEQLDDKYNQDGDGEHPHHTRADWRDAVANEDTISGYWDWVFNTIQSRDEV